MWKEWSNWMDLLEKREKQCFARKSSFPIILMRRSLLFFVHIRRSFVDGIRSGEKKARQSSKVWRNATNVQKRFVTTRRMKSAAIAAAMLLLIADLLCLLLLNELFKRGEWMLVEKRWRRTFGRQTGTHYMYLFCMALRLILLPLLFFLSNWIRFWRWKIPVIPIRRSPVPTPSAHLCRKMRKKIYVGTPKIVNCGHNNGWAEWRSK